jgi:pyridoxal phosphate enzyme (YggS family)
MRAEPQMTDSVADFERAREHVLGRIADACARAGRSPADVTLVAVSKTVMAERVRLAVAAGFTTLGENRVQELADKVADVSGATWHLIGPLQSNKARRAVEVASVIESVDSVDLARRLDRIVREVRGLPADGVVPAGQRLPVFLQVNVDEDPRKAGFPPDDVASAVAEIAALTALEVRGLMTVGRLVASSEQARPTFAGLRELSARVRATHPEALGAGLSMGMSEDYPIAVEEGATVVRVGRAIFGERPAP